ncbi:hypothetical protein GobsT_73160 [Gemmata obscuriglobus]|uniref:Uncharacterized protein n=1 Tax=Gemmata obscuriglobus TaxID=114 RepID=A0A2Z3HF88_9BACT|nr:hypothetical protein [Gemmata obscuriglobus]AWM41615.1 hypothetical protein C1280_34520 [Gemmata obscuriglobus]QEG32461.1 hypothetical protein GobsT_73160 [Gemmata obscuriglobus]VTS11817.1 unnamed protein product [Gemmata obscuriglobus UQM 2246]
MRLIKEILQIPVCVIGLAFVGGAVSVVTTIACEEIGLVRYASAWDSVQAWLRTLLLGTTVGGLIGLVWSARRCNWQPVPVREADDEVW